MKGEVLRKDHWTAGHSHWNVKGEVLRKSSWTPVVFFWGSIVLTAFSHAPTSSSFTTFGANITGCLQLQPLKGQFVRLAKNSLQWSSYSHNLCLSLTCTHAHMRARTPHTHTHIKKTRAMNHKMSKSQYLEADPFLLKLKHTNCPKGYICPCIITLWTWSINCAKGIST